jgi:hypothetical protein
VNYRIVTVVVGFDERVAPAKFIVRMLQTHRRLRFLIGVGDHFPSLHNELQRRVLKARSITVVLNAGSSPCVPIRAIRTTVVNIESS